MSTCAITTATFSPVWSLSVGLSSFKKTLEVKHTDAIIPPWGKGCHSSEHV
jgi:hypothetical protein